MDCIGVGQDRDMGSLVGNKTLSRPRCKWADIIKINIEEVGCGRMDCNGLGQDMEMGKLGTKSTLSRPRCKWDDINEIYLQKMGCGLWTVSGWFRIGKWRKF